MNSLGMSIASVDTLKSLDVTQGLKVAYESPTVLD